MTINLDKPNLIFTTGYRQSLNKNSDGKNLRTTCFSFINRYENQTDIISQMMKDNRNGALKVFNVGISQGQEALTHINSAFNIIKCSDRSISDVLDLSGADILMNPTIEASAAKKLSPKVVEHLKALYRNPSKMHFGTSFESLVPKMLINNQKQDVALFNNVIQHMDFSNKKSTLSSIENLINLVKKNGIFCFTCETSAIKNSEVKCYYNEVLGILKNKNFKEISNGIFKLL